MLTPLFIGVKAELWYSSNYTKYLLRYTEYERINVGTRKVEEEHLRNLTKNSTGTYSVSIPIALVRKLKWQRGQKLTVRQQGKKLIIEDWQP